jgi:hypothetical protein
MPYIETKSEVAEEAAKRPTLRSVAAFHEAGHAVAAHMLGREVKRVSIDDDGDGGLTRIKRLGRDERAILITLAGPYAQRRHAPRSRWSSRNHTGFRGDTDFDVVTEWIHDRLGKGKVAEKYWAYVEAHAEQLVNQYWQRIESVARELIERGVIEGDLRRFFPHAANFQVD